MSTLQEMVDYIRHSLSGYDSQADQVTELVAGIDTDDLTLTVDSTTGAGPGLVEIDMELIKVKSVNQTNSTMAAFTFGRGYRSTVPASHAAGAEVRINPAWPASTVARAINDTITELYPDVYAIVIETQEIPADFGPITLDGDPAGVIAVFIEDDSITDGWIREDRWDFNADRSDVGRDLRIGGPWQPGTTVKVVYAARPGLFSLTGSMTQEFSTETGLDARLEPLVQLGVMYRLAPAFDVARLPFLGAEARTDGESRPSNGGASSARLLYSMFQQRLQQEAMVLAKEHPIRLHKVR